MARKKKLLVPIPPNVLEAQKKLDTLFDEKYTLLKQLRTIHDEFNSLSDRDAKSTEDWLYSLPIETASALGEKRLTRLGKVRIRQGLKKDSSRVLNEIDQVESKIRLAYLDLLEAKVVGALGENA